MAIQKITKEEQEHVDKLKAKLNEIKQSANVNEGYELWDIKLEQESTNPKLDLLLVKFLRARDLDLIKAAQMLTNTLIWRKDFKTDNILDEAIDDSEFKDVSFIYKQDKEGRPVCYNFYGDIDQNKVFADPEKFIRWRVQVMERGVQLIDFENTDSMVVIHDYKGASLFGRTANAKAATKEIIKIMQDNYPEFLYVKFFVNIPSWGNIIFKLVRPLLSEATTKKFVVCSTDELYETLTSRISPENLPKAYQKKEKSVKAVEQSKKEEEATTGAEKEEETKNTEETAEVKKEEVERKKEEDSKDNKAEDEPKKEETVIEIN